MAGFRGFHPRIYIMLSIGSRRGFAIQNIIGINKKHKRKYKMI